mgnify:CR=1 FL=1
MGYYELRVTDDWIRLVHKSVSRHLETWAGGDSSEQVALMETKANLDRLLLEVVFLENIDE